MIGWNRWTSTVIWRLKQVLVGSLGVALEQSEQSACLWRLKLGFQTTRLACPTVVALAVCLGPSTCCEMGSGDSILRRLRLWPTQQSCNWADQEQMSWKGQRQDQDANRHHLLWPIFLHARMILVTFGHIVHVASTGLRRKCMFRRSLSQDISFSEIKDPGVTGNFEIKVNGALVHSKKTMSEFLNVTVTNSAKHQSNVNYMNVCLHECQLLQQHQQLYVCIRWGHGFLHNCAAEQQTAVLVFKLHTEGFLLQGCRLQICKRNRTKDIVWYCRIVLGDIWFGFVSSPNLQSALHIGC